MEVSISAEAPDHAEAESQGDEQQNPTPTQPSSGDKQPQIAINLCEHLSDHDATRDVI